MANGVYGTKRPALVTSDDVEIFYHYRPSRSTDDSDFTDFKKLDSSILSTANVTNDSTTSVLPGMFDLNLPLGTFGKVGIYTIYIKPKEIEATILDVSTLADESYSNVRGIVIDTSESSESCFNNGELVGYRVEYFDTDGVTRLPYTRIVTSNYKCEPVARYSSSTSSSNVSYSYNDSSNLIFCTLSPSTAMSFKTDSLPYIGKPSQKVVFINTKFNPVMLEVEMVAHDIETLSTMVEGTQLRNLDQAIITTFNDEGEIYHQATYGTISNPYTGIHHDFKVKKDENINYDEKDRLEEIEDNI